MNDTKYHGIHKTPTHRTPKPANKVRFRPNVRARARARVRARVRVGLTYNLRIPLFLV